MGLRMAGIPCQRATNILVYICKQSGVEVLNYLDDLEGAEVEDRVQWAGIYWVSNQGVCSSHQDGVSGHHVRHCEDGHGGDSRASAGHPGGGG